MSFNGFVQKHDLKNKATSIIKFYQVLTSIGLDNVNIYLRDGPIITDIAIVNLHPFQGTHWVLYIHERYLDSYGCARPQKLPKFIIHWNGYYF